MKRILLAAFAVIVCASSASAQECTSDFSCRFGEKCVKAPYKFTGYCAKVVDQYGLPKFAPPDADSIGPGEDKGCQFDTECPIGFRCAKEPGALRGACLKNH